MNPMDSKHGERPEKAHSSDWIPDASSEMEEDQPLSLVIRKERKATNPEEWEKFSMKRLRMEGKGYSGRKLIADGVSVKAMRPERKMGPMCNSKKCASSEFKKKCTTFTFEERKNIHTKFWRELNWDQKKMFVIAHVSVNKKEAAERGKRVHPLYYLTNSNNERLEVCKQMFLNTLSIGKKAIINWTENSEHGIPAAKKSPKVKQYEDKFKILAFFAALPKQPQKGRKATSKIMVHESYRNLLHVYKSYVDYCQENKITPASRVTVCRKFHICNLELVPEYKDFDFTCENASESNTESNNLKQAIEDVPIDIQLKPPNLLVTTQQLPRQCTEINPPCKPAWTKLFPKQSSELNSCQVPASTQQSSASSPPQVPAWTKLFPKLSAELTPSQVRARTQQCSKKTSEFDIPHVPAWTKLFPKQPAVLNLGPMLATTEQLPKQSAEEDFNTQIPAETKQFSKLSALLNAPRVPAKKRQFPEQSVELNISHLPAWTQLFSNQSAGCTPGSAATRIQQFSEQSPESNPPRAPARKQQFPKKSARVVAEWPYHYLSALPSTRPFVSDWHENMG